LICAGLDRERYEAAGGAAGTRAFGDDLRAAGTEVLIERLAVIRRAHLHPRGAAGPGARTLRDGGALARWPGAAACA